MEPNHFSTFYSGLKQDLELLIKPPEETVYSPSQPVLSFVLFRGTRGYIERIVHQVNGCYQNGWYDSCLVMLRRLLEMLIIEAFEESQIESKIKHSQTGEFLYLSQLISKALAETSWNLTRNTRRALPKLKDLGDKSAHSRRFNAIRSDIDRVLPEIRVAVQEFLYIAKLK